MSFERRGDVLFKSANISVYLPVKRPISTTEFCISVCVSCDIFGICKIHLKSQVLDIQSLLYTVCRLVILDFKCLFSQASRKHTLIKNRLDLNSFRIPSS